VFFDLDGVLVDSRVAITRSMNAALEACGLEPRPERDLERFIGPPIVHSFAALAAEQGADPALAADCLAAYRVRYRERSVAETELVPEIGALVRELAARRPVAVVTTKPRVLAIALLDGLGLLAPFRLVDGPELSAPGEEKAVGLGRALAAVGDGDGDGAVMIGDRSHDVVAARAHGLPAIGVTWGIGSREELEAAGAQRVVDSVGELGAALAAG
jgi:phosphoglycolate phosphatase